MEVKLKITDCKNPKRHFSDHRYGSIEEMCRMGPFYMLNCITTLKDHAAASSIELTIDGGVVQYTLERAVARAYRLCVECCEAFLPIEVVQKAATMMLNAELRGNASPAPCSLFTPYEMTESERSDIWNRYGTMRISGGAYVPETYSDPFTIEAHPLERACLMASKCGKYKFSGRYMVAPKIHGFIARAMGDYYQASAKDITACYMDFFICVGDVNPTCEKPWEFFDEGFEEYMLFIRDFNMANRGFMTWMENPWHDAACDIIQRKLKVRAADLRHVRGAAV